MNYTISKKHLLLHDLAWQLSAKQRAKVQLLFMECAQKC